MLRRLAWALIMVSFIALPASAGRPLYGSARMEILVDGRPLVQYAAAGTRYVEALKGREYEIRLHNPYPVRVAVALSVDGLNTIDARRTTAQAARKWVIAPHGTITIGGWQTSMTEARRFHFTTEEQSYGQWLGRTTDLGIISAVFFRERALVPIVVQPDVMPRPDRQASRDGRSAAGAPPPSTAKAQPGVEGTMAGEAEYAATGIGRQTGHAVSVVQMDLEEAPAAAVSLRYEYRPQLVRLGILPPTVTPDPLVRREKARGFEGGFCPEPKRPW